MSKGPPHARASRRVRRTAVPRAKRSGAASGRGAPAATSRSEAASAIALPAECTLAAAESLKLKLAALVRNESPVTVDVSGVRRIDTASLQLLAAFARDRSAGCLAVELRGESAAFAEGMRLLGLTPLFERAAGARPM